MPSGNSSGIIAALKVCVSPRDLWRGSQIHLELLHRHGQHSVRMGNTLISMYARCGSCGSLAGARVVFDRLPCHDVVSWTNLILAYAGNAEEALALEIFRSMEARGVEPEARTFVAALAACSGLGEKEEGTLVDGKVVKLASLDRGMALHCGARERGFDGDMFVTNTLIAMYAKCGCLVDASMAFTGMELHTVVSWNALIVGCLDNGKAELALELFQFMNQTPYKCVPAARTFAAVLMACSSLGSKLEDVIRMHSMASSMTGCLDMYVENGLVAAYAKCGSLASSRGIFRRMPCHSVVSWTSMIQAEAEAGNFDAAMETFEAMKTEGCAPNPRTFLALLMACSKLADDDDLAANWPPQRASTLNLWNHTAWISSWPTR